jgi:hypothetical protein
MHRWLAVFLLLGACAQPGPKYKADDPLSNTPTAKDRGKFRAVILEEYRATTGRLELPIVAMFSRDTGDGDAALIVERYENSAGITPAAFTANLKNGKKAATPKSITLDGTAYEIFTDLEFVRYVGRVPRGDPYRNALGAKHAPPRLSLIERRRFLPGGRAYKLYRCKKAGAWGILADYHRAYAKGDLKGFRSRGLSPAERRLLSVCFGGPVLLAVDGGSKAPVVAKPSMYRLRVMARDEWMHGANRYVERESLHLRIEEGGFWVLRYRAPLSAFAHGEPAFHALVSSFRPDR